MDHSLLHGIARSADYASAIHEPYNRDGARTSGGRFEKKAADFSNFIERPGFKLSDLPAYLDALQNANGIGMDDRELLLEKVLVLMSRMEDTELSMKVQRLVIGLLYKDLPHPPSSYLRGFPNDLPPPPPNANYVSRSADGSNYNILFPNMGKAGTPYARSVSATRAIPKHVLPDAGLVFDTLLRRDEFVPHPGGISSLFFAFADLVIHSIFDTNHTDPMINDTSSYLDLSILYGNSEAQMNEVRRKDNKGMPDGTGRLWDDVFADSRLLYMPPATCALLVLLNRNHNYIAKKILDINENGNFVFPPPTDDAKRAAQDDEIFHRARLVNCGFFMQIILGDYVGAILGLVKDGCAWRLDPLMTMREPSHEFTPRGEGNVVSVEFNLLYRWHTPISVQDDKWTTSLFNKLFDGKDPKTVTVDDFRRAAHAHLIPPKDIKKWTFNGLVREPNGRFKDEDLARIIQDGTENRAAAFKARGTPEVLRVIEVLGIEQAREWGTCSLNEFRKFLGLKPYKTFKEWNNDEAIHTAAAALYKDIDNLELHVGLQAEQAKDAGPGAGLCPGYTISRAILSDAVCLSRGDRFMTTEFTPHNLTSWGYDDCHADRTDGSYGGLLTKLLFRTLPDHYPAGSAYAHFPFLDPKYMQENVSNNPKLADKYTWTRPRRPTPTVKVDTYEGVKEVLKKPHFMSAYSDRMYAVTKHALAREIASLPEYARQDAKDHAPEKLDQGRLNIESLLPVNNTGDGTWAEYFRRETLELIQQKSIKYPGQPSRCLDIVQDVINLLPVHWISEEIIGLPLKTSTNQHGAWHEQDTYQMFADVGRYVFCNFDPANDFSLRESATKTFNEIAHFTRPHLDEITWMVSISDLVNHSGIEDYHSHTFLKKALDSAGKVSRGELTAYIFAAVVPTAAHFSQVIAHVVDFYLDEDKRREREEIVKLSTSHDHKDIAEIMRYVHEALRINPPVSGIYRTAAKDISIGPLDVRAGDRVFASLVDANLDTDFFGANPTEAVYTRPAEKAGLFGLGEDGLLSSKFFESVAPIILGTILGLKNLRRAPGQSGRFARFVEEWHESPRQQYINAQGKVTPFPDSLMIQYDCV